MSQKRQIDFSAYDQEQEPQSQQERETKADYVAIALDEYLKRYKPFREADPEFVETKTSREIQGDIEDVVTASISAITEYMIEHGYTLTSMDGGKLAWLLQDNF